MGSYSYQEVGQCPSRITYQCQQHESWETVSEEMHLTEEGERGNGQLINLPPTEAEREGVTRETERACLGGASRAVMPSLA